MNDAPSATTTERRRGVKPGRRSASYQRACEELDRNGRTSVEANFSAKLFGTGPIVLDAHGFTFDASKTALSYAWSEIQKSLSIAATFPYTHNIVFYVLKRNHHFGERRLFVNTKDECVLTQGKLPCSYATGQHRLIELMNRLRNQAVALQPR